MFSARPTSAAGTAALARLTWQDFEHLLAEHYRAQGYRVEHHAPATSLKTLAAGVDLRLTRGTESVILQCKHWDALEVEVQEVNELLSVMLNEAATKGILVTRGRFSTEAIGIQRRQPRLQLMDGDVLSALLKLPDHLDSPVAGSAVASPVAKKSAKAARRRRTSSHGSRLLPVLLGVGILVLLGLFAWKTMSRHDTVADTAPPPADATPAAAPLPAPIRDLPPAPPAPLSGASGIVSVPGSSSLPPPPTHELMERQRALEKSERERASRQKSEDGMKVLEQNTRELGSHD
ncbi:restriction endonuclease [Luteibacter sp. OK325]|uniref:restriction endonuclease n=1 Tax=Luteibacter sp. OK325 TaxID=2135670 RepID=UPI000D399E2C|nr:restriction endonuclease [Luteibacter sp. OK325]PTR34512.1 restriction endonuclease [Luteibacter sp. OK325]